MTITIEQLPLADAAGIDDSIPASKAGLTVRLTGQMIVDLVAAAIVNGAPGALDTLNELAAALGDDENFAATVTTALSARLEKGQNLADLPDKTAARNNLGANNAGNLTAGFLPDERVSASLPRTKAFRQGNLLGSVGQAAGVPTGAVIERGSNANGEYVRLADGTQICSTAGLILTATCDTVRASGVSGASSAARPTWTFPAAFVAPPVVQADASGGTATSIDRFAGVNGAPTITSVSLQAMDLTGGTTNTVEIVAIAVGRWF